MTEKVVIPPPEAVVRLSRPQVRRGDIDPAHFRIFRDMPSAAGESSVSPMAHAGEGFRIHVTGLTHDERGYPAMTPAAQEWNVNRLIRKIRDHQAEITLLEERHLDDAQVVVVAYGISARTSLWPIEQARREGIRVGLLRLITVWPFPEARVRDLAGRVRAFVVPEVNMGQMVREVERSVAGQAGVYGVNRPGGDILEPERVLAAIRRAAAN